MIASYLLFSLLLPVVESDSDDLKRDMRALELFLQDKKDHEKYCPNIDWTQPDISVYKKKLESQLPKRCKK